MKRSLDRLSRRISTTFYSLGVASLVISLVLSLAYQPANASEMIEQGPGNCATGWVAKVESAPFVYNGSQIITSVYVKSATNCFLFTQDGSNGCYAVTGLGTTNVTVVRVGTPSPACQEISHVEFYSNVTATPTNTPITPTATNTSTSTPTNTPVTPTATSTPVTTTPTNTPITPTATDTPIGPTATATNTQETPNPTATETQQTPTPTSNGDPQTSTATPTENPPAADTTPSPTPDVTSTPPATLPPPSEPTRTPLLVPVTGIDLTQPGGLSTGALPSLFFNLGLLLLGLGLVVHGLGNHLSKKDEDVGFEK